MRSRMHRGSLARGPTLVLALFLATLGRPEWTQAQERTAGFEEKLSTEDLRLQRIAIDGRVGWTRVRLRGATHGGDPGLPSLPRIVRQVAIPKGATILRLQADTGEPLDIEGHPLVEWEMRARPSDGERRPPKPPTVPQGPDGTLVFHRIDERPVPLSTKVLESPVWPPKLAEIVGRHELAGHIVVTVAVSPVQWIPESGTLRFTPDLRVHVVFTGGTPPDLGQLPYGEFAELQELGTRAVNLGDLNAKLVYPFAEELDAWYLIVTDNRTWNENKTPDTTLSGDLVGQLQRLADWKTQKGIQAKVVTVTDVIDGRYGDFASGARDTQEAIRSFLKHARSSFNTYWVLLGGDVTIIPPREVVGNVDYLKLCLERVEQTPPNENECYWDAAHEHVHIHHDGTIESDVRIASKTTGRVFSRVSSPSAANPGWTYVTSKSFSTPTTSETSFIVLAGPLADTELTDFYILDYKNTIPTDLYYASLDSPLYDQPGLHDWDLNDNEVYGQYDGGNSIDGVDYTTDLIVGRAPVETEDEARAFVDKVLAYEKYEGVSAKFGMRLLLGSSNWDSGPAVEAGGADPPEEGYYYALEPRGNVATCHFTSAPDSASGFDLVAYNGPGDYGYVPYDRNAGPFNLGYYFCTDDTYATLSEVVFEILGTEYRLPQPTRHVKVAGSSADIHPAMYFFESVDPDQSMAEKESIRDLIDLAFPGMSAVKRLYEDYEDASDYPAATLFELSEEAMEDALNTGYNLVSLSGHGSYRGAAGLNRSYASTLTNGFEGGIAFVDSCYTNEFDKDDAVSEVLLTNPDGGAVGYIGNSRYGWVGTGHDFEYQFWLTLALDRHFGRAFSSKYLLTYSDPHRWSNFTLNLLGCPEMPVWVGTPETLDVTHPTCLAPGKDITATVKDEDGDPVAQAVVCLTGPGDHFDAQYTDASGEAVFSTSGLSRWDELTLTVTFPDCVPYQATFELSECVEAFVRGDANGDQVMDISDAISVLNVLFLGVGELLCRDAADANDDGVVDISDAVTLLGYLFTGGELPPGTEPGTLQEDGTPDDLDCTVYPQPR